MQKVQEFEQFDTQFFLRYLQHYHCLQEIFPYTIYNKS